MEEHMKDLLDLYNQRCLDEATARAFIRQKTEEMCGMTEDKNDSLTCQCGHNKCFHKIEGSYAGRDRPGRCEKTCCCQAYIPKPIVSLVPLPEARILGVRRFWVSNATAMAIGAIVTALIRALIF